MLYHFHRTIQSVKDVGRLFRQSRVMSSSAMCPTNYARIVVTDQTVQYINFQKENIDYKKLLQTALFIPFQTVSLIFAYSFVIQQLHFHVERVYISSYTNNNVGVDGANELTLCM